jgi:hypothetical protein
LPLAPFLVSLAYKAPGLRLGGAFASAGVI